VLDGTGAHLGGPEPTKETVLHLACYRARRGVGAVVHLHSRSAVAVSCLAGLDPRSALPPLTPYFVMRVGRLPVVPYHRPGDSRLGPAVERVARGAACLLLANHGPVVTGADLAAAAAAAEELEETAALHLLLSGHPTQPLDRSQTTELERVFGASWE
jgi:ribulose-5-phosphate 4-epimerase/fuculose-1-phosphate aldolase